VVLCGRPLTGRGAAFAATAAATAHRAAVCCRRRFGAVDDLRAHMLARQSIRHLVTHAFFFFFFFLRPVSASVLSILCVSCPCVICCSLGVSESAIFCVCGVCWLLLCFCCPWCLGCLVVSFRLPWCFFVSFCIFLCLLMCVLSLALETECPVCVCGRVCECVCVCICVLIRGQAWRVVLCVSVVRPSGKIY
jgi:hypothetical protein